MVRFGRVNKLINPTGGQNAGPKREVLRVRGVQDSSCASASHSPGISSYIATVNLGYIATVITTVISAM